MNIITNLVSKDRHCVALYLGELDKVTLLISAENKRTPNPLEKSGGKYKTQWKIQCRVSKLMVDYQPKYLLWVI